MRYRQILEACWKGYTQKGMKKKGEKMVPNCVPVSEQELEEGSDWGEPREILEDVLQTLEREVEWPLTEVMDPKQVRQLLSPLVRAVNDKLLSMDEGAKNWGNKSKK